MQKQLEFLKRHGFVIAGLGLPLLVVLAFALARALPRYLVPDARYELVYSSGTNDYSGNPPHVACAITAVDGRVRVRWTPSEQPVYGQTRRIFRFDPTSGETREIETPEPDFATGATESQDVYPAGLEDVHIETSLRAPDGYEFEAYYGRGGGIFGDLFYSGNRGTRSRIVKDGRMIALPHSTHDVYGYNTISFIGWAIPREEGR